MSDDVNDDELPTTFSGPDALASAFMVTEILMVEPNATMAEVARLIAGASVGCVVVGSAEKVEAVATERDVARAVADGLELDVATAGERGTRSLVWASVDDSIGSVATEMMEDWVRHVLVGDERGLAGILSIRDVLAAYAL